MASYFITGASRGLGLQLTTTLASRPSSEVSKIFAAARKQSDDLKKLTEESNGRVQFVFLEVTSQQSAEEAARTVEKSLNGQGLDYLINNAGIMNTTPNGIVDMKDLGEHLNTNVIGVNNVITALLPLVRKSNLKKIINITSTMGSLTMSSHFQQLPTPAYKISKTALNMLTVQYAEAFRDEGVTFIALCPGWVKTDMGGKDYADLTPEEAIAGILEIADKVDVKDTGKFLTVRVPGWENHEKRYDGSVRPW
ncbi:hypothetical protein J7T55_000979 [Diaporthe amygdali]|uniref:uncharacterized protein n=1 Tax=Phomopsis amygdali TaxID=1214568 RepID=UPI0022FEC5FF|nr:uncharacterized protein J7T55_000979 [Diaporthe amygdali]KAJ0120124.1 hypothetical protein J7T55_000979 [Diaporthe amygdali]